ncbi:MAG: glycosyltransferase family 39 protein [Cyanobacteria bacterium P01_F01_bin.150]
MVKVLRTIDRWSDSLIGLSLLVAAVLIFTLGLGDVALRDWDEGLVAQVSKEIASASFRDNAWLHPTLHGQPYFNKPPFVHWWVAIAYSIGGINEWTARLPGALATALSVFFLYRLGREMFPLRLTAFFSASIYLTLLPVVRHGRLAMLDGMVLCAFLSLLLCSLRSRRSFSWALGIGLSLSVLILTKGIIAIPLMVIALVFIGWDTPRLLRAPPWWGGILLGFVPGLLWYAAQGLHYGSIFWDTHFLKQSLDRVAQVVEQHSGPPWYYGVELLKYSWPWLLFFPMGTVVVWNNRAHSWAKLIMVWGVGYFGLISMMGTKLPWYIMPFYPVFSLIIGLELQRIWQTISGLSPTLTPSRIYQWILLSNLILLAFIGLAGAGYFSGYLNNDLATPRMPDWSLSLALGTLGLTMAIAAVLLRRRDRQFISVMLWGFYCCLLIFVTSHHWNWELGEDYEVKPIASMIRNSVEPSKANLHILTSHPYNRPSLDFYSGYNVQPAGPKRIQKRWDKDPSLLLLINQETLEFLNLKHMDTIGKEGEWVLIRRIAQHLNKP